MEPIAKLKSQSVLSQIVGNHLRPIASNPLIKQTVVLAVLGASNTAFAVLVSWYVMANVGVGEDTDAFFASKAMPQFVFNLLTATLLPVLVPLLATRNDDEFHTDVWALFSLATIIFVVIGLGLFLSTGLWVPLFVPGFSTYAKTLTVDLMRIQLISMVLNVAILALWAAHHARHRFVWVELSSLIANGLGLVFLVLTIPRLGIKAAALNAVFFNTLKLVFLFPILGGVRWPKWRSPVVREAWQRFKPLLPGQTYLRTDPVLDRFLTSMTHSGMLSLLYVAQQAFASVVLLLTKAVVAPMTPRLAVDAREGQWFLFRKNFRARVGLVLVVTIAALLLLVLGAPVFWFAVAKVGFTESNIKTLWITMIALGGSLVGGAMVQATANAFYATGNTNTPSKISALVYTIYIPLKIIAFFKFGIIGIAIAMSSYFLTNSIVQYLVLRKDISRKTSGADE